MVFDGQLAPERAKGVFIMTIKFDTLRDRWIRDPKFRQAYDKISPEMEIAFAIAEARHRAHLSQHQLAKKIGTSQAHS